MRLVFCGTGWLSIVDRIAARLPSGATIRVRDQARPIADEVRDAHVIVPSNAHIGPSEMDAARELRLILSLHVPLDDRTRGLVSADALGRMKRGALLVNCARGPIVDRDALLSALESGHLGGAGLDVHAHEPPDPSDPLYLRDDVIALPHVAGSTAEAFDALVDVIVENVGRLARGEPPIHRVA